MNQLVVSGVGAVNGTERCFTNMCHAREREHHSRRCKACPICAILDDFPACAGMTNVGLVGRDTVVASPRRLSLDRFALLATTENTVVDRIVTASDFSASAGIAQ